jgi:hypothetical protein
VSFLVERGINVEEYQRMQQSRDGSIQIGDLSQSVRVEVEGKVKATGIPRAFISNAISKGFAHAEKRRDCQSQLLTEAKGTVGEDQIDT